MRYIPINHYQIISNLLEIGEKISLYPLERFSSDTHSREFNRELIFDLAKEYDARRFSNNDNLHATYEIARRALFRLETSRDMIDLPGQVFSLFEK